MSVRIELAGVTKRFGPVVANRNVDLTLTGGQVHALLGENGAGKSTLMNVLYGLVRPESGEIRIDGRTLPPGSTRAALAAGIWMVHQHFMLVGPLTVRENLLLAFQGTAAELRRRAEAAAAAYGLHVNLDARVDDLPVGQRQRVEILKGVIQEARCLILDEPTAVLAESETAGLFQLMRTLAAEGRIVVLITHKVAEVLESCHRVTVLRGGAVAGTFDPRQTTGAELVAAVIGGSLEQPHRRDQAAGEVVLTVDGPEGQFQVRRGEVFGIAGVDGNGQVELAETVVGLRPSPQVQRSGSLAYIPQDRMRDGLAGPFSVAENLALRHLAAGTGAVLPARKSLLAAARNAIREFDIRPPLPDLPVERLSGGNQQKVVLARELGQQPDLLVAVQPVRGLDPGAAAFVQERILRAAAGGAAVLYVSTDLDELFLVAHRIGVLYRGRLVDIAARTADGFPREQIGAWMTGVMA